MNAKYSMLSPLIMMENKFDKPIAAGIFESLPAKAILEVRF